jgi:polyisoprenoid-binding protein YceI
MRGLLQWACVVLALGAGGCATAGAQARVGPRQPENGALSACRQLEPSHELDTARSTIRVAGADRVTGEHVGVIGRFSGTATLSDTGVPIAITLDADLQSLSLDSAAVEDFVKSPSFLDVERYPTASFRSCEVTHNGSELRLRGVLRLHGVTREIDLPASLTSDARGPVVRANFRLPRHDFEIERADALDALISSEIRVELELRPVSD